MNNFFDKFKLHAEKEEFLSVTANIDRGVVFRGTNLWVLIFAIFLASLGLNVNSPAVIIGAMLISPLMGPIMGLGLGVGINDIVLLRKAINNYLVATGVALTTSTIFFLVSPFSDAHSEILARTSPTIYDVLIALFGGFAGIVATTSKLKGNVIPGVAIATALMPPLCTSGYGLATLQFNIFFGAFYLFIINTVFIALATFVFVRVQHFPHKHLQDERTEKITHLIIWAVVLATLLPSIYFGYEKVQQNKFTNTANRFISGETHFTNDYLLNRKIDAKNKTISLVFGGNEISREQIEQLRNQLNKYGLGSASLEIKQGFASLLDSTGQQPKDEQLSQLTEALVASENQQKSLQLQMDSIINQQQIGAQVYAELKTRYPALKNAIIRPTLIFSDSAATKQTFLVWLLLSKNLPKGEKRKIENWLKVRLHFDSIKVIFQK